MSKDIHTDSGVTEQYTREQILAMEPGRELNRLIVQHVTDYQSPTTAICPDGTFDCHIPKYSTEISAAWEVVITFDVNTFNLNWLDRLSYYGEGWHCKLDNAHAHECKTAPEAICKAALLAVMDL